MAEWYIQMMGEVVIGPLSSTELLEKVRAGEVSPDTEIRKDDSAWVPAINVNGLFERAGRRPVHFYCPNCGSELDRKPPVGCIDCGRFIESDATEQRDEEQFLEYREEPNALSKLRGLWNEIVLRFKKREPDEGDEGDEGDDDS